VENTCIGINRDVAAMIERARLSGLNVVCGTGFYVERTQTDSVKNASVEELSKVLVWLRFYTKYG
jgi:phosphotriesterase-related protein